MLYDFLEPESYREDNEEYEKSKNDNDSCEYGNEAMPDFVCKSRERENKNIFYGQDYVVKVYLKQIAKFRLLSREEEREYFIKIAQGDTNMKSSVIEANLRLVVNIAKKYMHQGLPFSDLIQEGNLGLIRAVEKFDYEYGVKFSTYAVWWIKQRIIRALWEKGRTVRIPVHIIEGMKLMEKKEAEFLQKNQKEPDIYELAEFLEIPAQRVQQLAKRLNPSIFKNHYPEKMSSSKVADWEEDTQNYSPLSRVINDDIKRKIQKVLDTLPMREQKILTMRFGFDSSEGSTLQEIGTQCNLSKERVRQLQKEIIEKLKNGIHSKKLYTMFTN
ncbi:MAG: RNA polymerase sigma factor RpoD/SigA [bacterium]